jgi:hypothetical protein
MLDRSADVFFEMIRLVSVVPAGLAAIFLLTRGLRPGLLHAAPAGLGYWL